MARPAKIVWSVEKLSAVVPAADVVEQTISFHADQALDGVTIAAVPELSRFVSITPDRTGRVPAGARVDLRLRWSIPEGTELGDYDGTIHVRDGRSTLASPLAVKLRVAPPDPTWVSKGVVTLEGVSATAFNPQSATARFLVNGATFSTEPGEVLVRVNGQPVPVITVSAMEVSAQVAFREGLNRLSVYAIDGARRILYFGTTLWAGSSTLKIRVLDEKGQLAEASVTIRAGDDQQIGATATTVAGVATFTSVMDRTILVEARGAANRYGHTATHGGAGTVTLRMRGFDSPSAIANNDFSQGTAGWNIGTAPVRIVPHTEPHASAARIAKPVDRPADREAAWREFQQRQSAGAARAAAAATTDHDMVVTTRGEGPQTVSRTFETSANVKSVTVRHRFITSEVPGGWFGSEFNDSFSVTIRSQAAGGVATFSQTMNGLGLEAFIYDTGETREWFEARLPVERDGDVVQIDATVSNVGDGLYDSQLVIDLVKEKRVEIGPLEAVVCGRKAEVLVTMADGQGPVTLELSGSGEGEATFADGDTTMTIESTTTVTINGVTVSSSKGDVVLTASADGEELDEREFTVIWVDIEIRNAGVISIDNDVAWKYVEAIGSDELGLTVMGAKLNYNIPTCAIEAVGTVKPSDFDGKIRARRRIVSGARYTDQLQTMLDEPRDDTSEVMYDDDPTPNGHVYDLDAPGDRAHGHSLDKVYRLRINMLQYFTYGDEDVSDRKPWFSAYSFKRTGDRDYAVVYEVAGDNQCGEGGPIEITWNLLPEPKQ